MFSGFIGPGPEISVYPYERRWVSIVSSFRHFLYNILHFYCYSYFLKILIMVLTRSQHENMSKEELIQELTNINSSFVNDINAKLTDLSDRFNEFTSKYDKVYSELQQCKSYNSHLLTRIIQLERNAVTNSQYSRRETIELNPVPAEIHQDVLEDSICKALSLTGVNVVPEDLQACHRMKRSDRVI